MSCVGEYSVGNKGRNALKDQINNGNNNNNDILIKREPPEYTRARRVVQRNKINKSINKRKTKQNHTPCLRHPNLYQLYSHIFVVLARNLMFLNLKKTHQKTVDKSGTDSVHWSSLSARQRIQLDVDHTIELGRRSPQDYSFPVDSSRTLQPVDPGDLFQLCCVGAEPCV